MSHKPQIHEIRHIDGIGMSPRMYIVIEIVNEHYDRLMRYWMTKERGEWFLNPPISISDTGWSHILEFVKDDPFDVMEVVHWLKKEFNISYSDLYVSTCTAYSPFDRTSSGNLKASFHISEWRNIAPKKDVELVSYNVDCEFLRTMMGDILSGIRETNALLSEILHGSPEEKDPTCS